ncbi:hypothetical protein D915_000534 [Fasciola hepatica]|uniref:EF-hand domain-containing protein n=1 Tax=Fasciola hepatica TaxID=6192 RepID=A0A4E0S038_FASHE|nr:hypothetical protein D915_000534 [Fasciola hepatica]
MDELEAVFNMIDKNKDGRVSRKELSAFFKKNSVKISSKQLKEQIQVLDLNGDGYLSLEELKAAFARSAPIRY